MIIPLDPSKIRTKNMLILAIPFAFFNSVQRKRTYKSKPSEESTKHSSSKSLVFLYPVIPFIVVKDWYGFILMKISDSLQSINCEQMHSNNICKIKWQKSGVISLYPRGDNSGHFFSLPAITSGVTKLHQTVQIVEKSLKSNLCLCNQWSPLSLQLSKHDKQRKSTMHTSSSV